MLYIVGLTIAEQNIVERMNEMRTWLDHRHIEPAMFRLVDGEVPGELRVNFTSQADAVAFAAQFGGEVSAVAGVVAGDAFNSRSASSSGSGRVRPS